MIINNNIQAIASTYAANNVKRVGKVDGHDRVEAGRDEILLSTEAKSFSSLLQELKKGTAAVRQDKVDALEQQISAGTYDVEGSNVAARMLSMRF